MFPTFPLTPNFENSDSFEVDVNKSQYGKGFTERGLKGVNPIRKNKQISVNTRKFAVAESFLSANMGKPFFISLDGGATNDGKLYKLLSYSWVYISPDVRGFRGDFTQVRKPTNQ